MAARIRAPRLCAMCLMLAATLASGQLLDDNMMDNSLSPDTTDNRQSGGGSGRNNEPLNSVNVSVFPPSKIVQPVGATIELECEVTGIPPPTIHWVRGTNPEVANNAHEANMITSTSTMSIVRVRSRIIIDRVSAGKHAYTCVGRSGGQMDYATTVVYGSSMAAIGGDEIASEAGIIVHDRTPSDGLRKPSVVYYFALILDLMGSDVFLPCRAAGHPRAQVYWMDKESRVIGGPNGSASSDGRHIVLPNGGLMITGLQWSDMGSYKCVAENSIGTDAISTFVYPLKE